ncbi:hypothetical protein LTR02_007833 [Friedmanniomyces endolithicus]|nr:hypothetical protein LTR59_006127 [Friedmanniomyces endolithicus]KAK0902963.1 hypothetical protein LTR02_007833 [Friedmanniomyces endolithicus]
MDTVMSSPSSVPVPVAPTTGTTRSSPTTAAPKVNLAVIVPPTPPPRSCIVCTSPEDLVRPCRNCSSDYCRECLGEMFMAATEDGSRMPPRCCNLLQIHTADLPHDLADEYRAKFEEWFTLEKTYCPSPACSAFIPERVLPPKEPTDTTISLVSILTELLTAVSKSPSSRFFRGELPMTELPGYTEVVARPMDLARMQANVQASLYPSMDDLTHDMVLIVDNAKLYNGSEHPITKTADQMFEEYLSELSKTTNELVRLVSRPNTRDPLTCPKCHIAICIKCKQIEHASRPCDTTLRDNEQAMLERFGYKRCPLCKHAVKKMYGCPFMQCVCGAHWCYYCQRSIDECDGVCDELAAMEDAEEEAEEEEDYDDDDDEWEHIREMQRLVPANEAKTRFNETAAPAPAPTAIPSAPTLAPPPPTQLPHRTPVDLDAGGARRWAEADEDFGEEPEEHRFQVWSCLHNFVAFAAAEDEHDHGDLAKMECNRCFAHVDVCPAAWKVTLAFIREALAERYRHMRTVGGVARSSVAMECKWCRLVVCQSCQFQLDTWRVEE